MNCVAVAPRGAVLRMNCMAVAPRVRFRKKIHFRTGPNPLRMENAETSPRGVHSYSKNLDSMRIAEGTDLFARDADRIFSI